MTNSSYDGPLFPPDLFTSEQFRSGAVILPMFGIVIVYLLLILVQEEFHIPAFDSLGKAVSELISDPPGPSRKCGYD